MGLEFIGYVRHSPPGLVNDPSIFDLDYLERSADIHRQAGYDRVLVGHGAHHPDAWQVAAHVAHVTRDIGVLIANRPGIVQPTVIARRAATLERIAGAGRVGLHIVTGGDEAEMRRDGDFVGHDARYRRSAEFMAILKRLWSSDALLDHAGEFYRVEGARNPLQPLSGRIPLFFAGRSEAAIAAGAAQADIYILDGEPLGHTASFIESVRAQAGERSPQFGIALRVVIDDTEEGAWEKAHGFANEVPARHAATAEATIRRLASPDFTAVGYKELFKRSQEAEIHDERLWFGYTRAVGASGTTSALVGTPAQVAEAILRYYDLGIRAIYLRGWDLLRDTADYGRELIPLVRRLVADRERIEAGQPA